MRVIFLVIFITTWISRGAKVTPCDSKQPTGVNSCEDGNCKTVHFSNVEELQEYLRSDELRVFLEQHLSQSAPDGVGGNGKLKTAISIETETVATGEIASTSPISLSTPNTHAGAKSYSITCETLVIKVTNCNEGTNDSSALADVKRKCDGLPSCNYTSTCQATHKCVPPDGFSMPENWQNCNGSGYMYVLKQRTSFLEAEKDCKSLNACLISQKSLGCWSVISGMIERQESGIWVDMDLCRDDGTQRGDSAEQSECCLRLDGENTLTQGRENKQFYHSGCGNNLKFICEGGETEIPSQHSYTHK